MQTALEVMALQSSINEKIDLYSKYWENKLQALTNGRNLQMECHMEL